jgi:hypothetical protein
MVIFWFPPNKPNQPTLANHTTHDPTQSSQMEKGAELSGSFSCRPVGRPPGRMLDVGVDVSFQGAAARVAYTMRRPQQRM